MSTNPLDSLPKVELHLHLEGSLRPQTLFALAERNGKDLGIADPAGLEVLYQFRDFGDFARLFRTGLDVLRTSEDFCDATVALAAELSSQRVLYAEVTTTPFQHTSRGVPLEAYAAGLNEGRRRAQLEYDVAIAWVCDISRESERPESLATVDFLVGPNAPNGAIGLGLGGFEVGFPPDLFKASFDKARAAGLAALPHAGETVGAQSVRLAVDTLGADRIGHGVRCLEDAALVRELVDRQIPLEVCPTSNVKLGVATSAAEHPLRDLIAAGLLVTLNTDDPAYFGTTLTAELQGALDHHQLSLADIAAMQTRALDVSFAPKDVRARFACATEEWSSS